MLPNSPKWLLSGDAEYSERVGPDVTAYAGAGLSYRTSAQAAFGETPGFKLPAYALLDLRAGVRWKQRWSAELWARNVTNKYYLNNVIYTIDTVSKFAGMPATYGVTIGFNY